MSNDNIIRNSSVSDKSCLMRSNNRQEYKGEAIG
ncbi:hypothetical protein LINGRAHAP2_LOCUS27853 [Linum grandiflorum]